MHFRNVFLTCGYSCIASDIDFGNFFCIGSQVILNNGNYPKNIISANLLRFNHMLLGVEEYMDEDHQLSTSIKIGNVVGIGSQSIVSIGGKKGDWAIAGGALVRESIPPYAIFSGSLGRITRYRFSTEVITRLLEAKPFNLSLDESLKMPIQHVEIPLGYFEALSAKRFNVD